MADSYYFGKAQSFSSALKFITMKNTTPYKRGLLNRVLIDAAWCLAGITAVVILAVAAVTAWLTPHRVANIASREVSKILNADVAVGDVNYTLWSTFPWLCFDVDSLAIVTHSMDVQNGEQLSADIVMPADADSLLSTGNVKGKLNILSILRSKLSMRDLSVDKLNLNLVALSDSVTNYNIKPTVKLDMKLSKALITSLDLTKTQEIRYRNLSQGTDILINPSRIVINDIAMPEMTAGLDIAGKATLSMPAQMLSKTAEGITTISDFPFALNGSVSINTDSLSVETRQLAINLGNVSGSANLDMKYADNLSINKLDYTIDEFDVMQLLSYLPEGLIVLPKGLEINPRVSCIAQLTEPYTVGGDALPSGRVQIDLADGAVALSGGRKPQRIDYSGLGVRLVYNADDKEDSYLEIPEFGLKGDNINAEIAVKVDNLADNPLINADIKGNTRLAGIAPLLKPLQALHPAGNLQADAHVSMCASDLKNPNLENVRMKGNISLSNFGMDIPNSTMRAGGRKITINIGGTAKRLTANSATPNRLNLNVQTRGLSLAGDSLQLYVENSKSGVVITKGKRRQIPGDYRMPSRWVADSTNRRYAPHSNPFLQIAMPGNINRLLSQWDVSLNADADGISILTRYFPLRNRIDNLSLRANADSVNIDRMSITSGDTRLAMSGNVTGLRRFLASKTPAPLYADLDIALDSANLNQLAAAYERSLVLANGPCADSIGPMPKYPSASDTIAMLLPRNILANVNLSIPKAHCLNMVLSDISAHAVLADGNVSVRNLTLSTGFARALADFRYKSSDIEAIGTEIKLRKLGIDIEKTLDAFPAITQKMPDIADIKGKFLAEADINMMMFPDMYVNIPSIWADFYLHSIGLEVPQTKQVRDITRFMMMHNDSTLNVSNFNLHASLRDCLVELFPCHIDVDRYELNLAGVNNLHGDMYYHLGIDKSPVPFPFGINVKGDFQHPKLRFGGAVYKVDQGNRISAYIPDDRTMNAMLQMKYYLDLFLHTAAEYDRTPASQFTY